MSPPSEKGEMPVDDRELRERVARMETLLEEIESLPDPNARSTAVEAVRALVDLYGEGLARVTEQVVQLGGEDALHALATDELLSHLLLVHGLHPDDVETRVGQALEEVRPYLQSHGGNVEFLGVEDGMARIRLQGSCNGCASSAMTLKLAIEEAILKFAPDLSGIKADGVAPQHPGARPVTFVPRSTHRRELSDWAVAGSLPQLAGNGLLLREVAGEPVLFLRVEQRYYAYQHRCPSCDRSLADGKLTGTALTCGACGHTYDIQRAGSCLDTPQLHLEPIPLLVSEAGLVKIALHSRVG